MRQFALGMAVGVMATATTFHFWPHDNEVASIAASPPGEPEAPGTRLAPGVASTVPGPLQPAGAASQPGSDKPVSVASALVPERAQPAPAGTATMHVSAEHAALLKPERPLTRELTLPEMHLLLLSEPRDPVWSDASEQSIHRFLAEHAPSPEFEIQAVECRTTLCEIQAFGNLPDSAVSWTRLPTGKMMISFGGISTTATEVNGRAVIITVVQREVKK